MAQLQKHNHLRTRNQIPCARCYSEEHATWAHGKDQWEIFRQLRSRKLNPQDPLFDPELFRLVHPTVHIGSAIPGINNPNVGNPITTVKELLELAEKDLKLNQSKAAVDNSTAQD